MVLQTRIAPFAHWAGQGSTSTDRRAHGSTSEHQNRKSTVAWPLTDREPISRRRSVSYRTSKRANITIRGKTNNPIRAINSIKQGKDLD